MVDNTLSSTRKKPQEFVGKASSDSMLPESILLYTSDIRFELM